jgi:hypothetical protein
MLGFAETRDKLEYRVLNAPGIVKRSLDDVHADTSGFTTIDEDLGVSDTGRGKSAC